MTIVRPPRTVVAPLAVAAATFFGAYGLLFAITHYPPIATFRSAVASQHWLLGRLHRPYPQSIPFDVLDYCLGLGWVIPVLAVLKRSPYNILAVAGLLTPIVLALTGQLQAENARVWIFLMPLTILPAALELSEWPLRARLASCASLVIVTIALASTMDFIFA